MAEMKKDVLYPKDYDLDADVPETKEALETRLEENYQTHHKATLVPLVKAMIQAKPVPYEKLVKALAELGAPGGTPAWQRAIRDVEKEWHPTKFEPAIVEAPKEK